MIKSIALLAGCCFCLAVFHPQQAEAQKRRKPINQRFKAEVLLGGNLSQVDGDKYQGFDKANLQLGIGGCAVLTRQLSLSTEILYMGKGARTPTSRELGATGLNRTIDLTYIEVPAYLRYKFDEAPNSAFFEVGISFGRLLNSKVTELEMPQDGFRFTDLEADFRANELSFLAGLGYQFNKYFGIKSRYTFAFTTFYDEPPHDSATGNVGNIGQRRIELLRNYAISVMFYCQL